MKKVFLLVIGIFYSGIVSAAAFEWDQVLPVWMKLKPGFDYEVYVDSYMKAYRRPVWKKNKNDEFAMQEKRQETIKIMKDIVNSVNLEDDFEIYTDFRFGDYDFEKEAFPLDSLQRGSYFSVRKSFHHYDFPSTIKFFVTGAEIIGDLKLDKNKAKALVQSRKSTYGHVDRTVFAKILISPVRSIGVDSIEAKVKSVYVYKSNDMNDLLAEFHTN